MKVKVKMKVSERLAILHDKEQAEEVIIEIDTKGLTKDEKKELLTLDKWDGFYYGFDRSHHPTRWGHEIAEANLDEFRDILAEHREWRLNEEMLEAQKADAQDQENKKLIAEWLQSPDQWRNIPGISDWHCHKKLSDYRKEIPEFDEAIKDSDSLVFWIKLENQVRDMLILKNRRMAQIAEQGAKAKSLALKEEYVRQWVSEKGTPSQKDRMAANLLDHDEVVNDIRNEVFAPLNDFPRYEKLKSIDICTCDCQYSDVDHCDCEFNSITKESATEEEFDLMQQIKKLMPDADLDLREHVGKSEQCDNTVKRTGILVTMKAGEFTFSREYAALR